VRRSVVISLEVAAFTDDLDASPDAMVSETGRALRDGF
jgi:hypothetical protein